MFYVDLDVVCSLEEVKMIAKEDKMYGDLVNIDAVDKVNGNLVVRLSSLFDTAVLSVAKRLGHLDALEFLQKEVDE